MDGLKIVFCDVNNWNTQYSLEVAERLKTEYDFFKVTCPNEYFVK